MIYSPHPIFSLNAVYRFHLCNKALKTESLV
ncbi:hypothetical protein A1S_3602 [Acinetobacter baumannii ATCC 17978]|nr:hypothetical protein A1S_3602 [Acinetobacter baumannii ATCC 17978]